VIAYSRGWTLTESNWLWGLGLATAGAAVLAVVGELEEALRDAPRHAEFVVSAWETLTRFLAIAHTIVATLFLLTSRRVRTSRGVAWLAGLAAAGAALCLGFHAMGGLGAALGVALFFGYFLVHEVRDELFFYRANGDGPAAGDAERPLWPLAALLVTAIALTLALAVLLGARARRIGVTGTPTPGQVLAAIAVAAAAVAAAGALVRRLGAHRGGGWRAVLRQHRPLLLVLGGVYAVLMGGFALTGRAYVVVAVHVTVWFVFALRRMDAGRGPARAPTWAWMRSTRAGFAALHGGVLAAVVAGSAVLAFAGDNAADFPLGVLLGRESFPYWTIMHVTLSWVPRAPGGAA
jgi:hypothetical protein